MLRKKNKSAVGAEIGTILEEFDEGTPEISEFRRLIWKIKRNGKSSKGSKTFLVTSAVAREGKTICASNLAIAFAKFGNGRVLLIDGDLRRPDIHRLFGLKRDPGFSDILSGRSGYEACLKDFGWGHLSIITCGTFVSKPLEVIQSEKVKSLLSQLSNSFDVIVMDSPPVLPTMDPLILGTETDATLLVVRAGKTPKEVVLRGKQILSDAQVNLLGVIVNNVQEALPYYYSYKHYRPYYGHDKKRPGSRSSQGGLQPV